MHLSSIHGSEQFTETENVTPAADATTPQTEDKETTENPKVAVEKDTNIEAENTNEGEEGGGGKGKNHGLSVVTEEGTEDAENSSK